MVYLHFIPLADMYVIRSCILYVIVGVILEYAVDDVRIQLELINSLPSLSVYQGGRQLVNVRGADILREMTFTPVEVMVTARYASLRVNNDLSSDSFGQGGFSVPEGGKLSLMGLDNGYNGLTGMYCIFINIYIGSPVYDALAVTVYDWCSIFSSADS